MNRPAASVSAAVLALAALTSASSAEVITQSFLYDWDSSQPQHQFSFKAFDDLGGTRQLTRVSLEFAGTLSMELLAQTYDPAGVPAGDWSIEATHTVVAYFNQGESGGLELLQGIGGLVMDGVTGELGGGVDGAPGAPYIAFASLDLLAAVDIDASFFADFTGTGQHIGFMDGFFDGAVTPPEGGQFVEAFATTLAQSGTITLTYEYTIVPAPGALTLLGAGGVIVVRRRRR